MRTKNLETDAGGNRVPSLPGKLKDIDYSIRKLWKRLRILERRSVRKVHFTLPGVLFNHTFPRLYFVNQGAVLVGITIWVGEDAGTRDIDVRIKRNGDTLTTLTYEYTRTTPYNVSPNYEFGNYDYMEVQITDAGGDQQDLVIECRFRDQEAETG